MEPLQVRLVAPRNVETEGWKVRHIAVAAAEEVFLPALVGLLEIDAVLAEAPAVDAAFAVLTPYHDTHLLGIVVFDEVGPSAFESRKKGTLINAFGTSEHTLRYLNAAAHAGSRGKVAAGIVQEGIGGLHTVLSEQGLAIATAERRGLGVDADMEMVEPDFLGIFIARLVELHHIAVGIARSLEVVVQTVVSEIAHGIDQRTDILVAIVTVGILRLEERHPSFGRQSRCPAFEELDAAVDIRTMTVCGIYHATRSTEEPMVPCAENRRVVPTGIGVVAPVARRISALIFPDADGNVHPQFAGRHHVVDHIHVGIGEDSPWKFVRTDKGEVHTVDADSLEFFDCRVLAAFGLHLAEEFEQFGSKGIKVVYGLILRKCRQCGTRKQGQEQFLHRIIL